MSRIHRRSPGTWEVVIESGRDPRTGKRLRRTFTVRGATRDVEREAALQVSATSRGAYVDPSKETVGQFLDRWLREYVEPSLTLRTRLRYRDIVGHDLIPQLGPIPQALVHQGASSSGGERPYGVATPSTRTKPQPPAPQNA